MATLLKPYSKALNAAKPHHYDVHDLPHGVQKNRHIDSVSHGHMITTPRTWDGGLRAKRKTLFFRRKPGGKKPFKLTILHTPNTIWKEKRKEEP